MFRQPRGFSASFISALCDTLSFYGVVSSIIVLLINVFHQNAAYSYQFYGMLSAIGFVTPALGGALSDRFYRRVPAILIGLGCILVGSILCTVMKFNGLVWGIACILIGMGLFKSNNITQLGMLYPDFSKQKEKGMTLVYLGMNLGAIIGPVAAAILGYFTNAYQAFFIYSAILLVIPIILYSLNYQYLIVQENQLLTSLFRRPIPTLLFLGIVLFFIVLVRMMLLDTQLFNLLFGLGLMAAIVYIIRILYQNIRVERLKMLFILVLCFFNIFYFICSIQLSGALLLFSMLYSNGILKIDIPMQWLSALQPLAILLMSPLILRWGRKNVSHDAKIDLTLRKFFWSLITASVAYFLFYIASKYSMEPIVFVSLLLIGIILIGFGEMVTMPSLFNAVSNLAEGKDRGFFMGLVWLLIAVASYLSSILAMIMVGNANGPASLSAYPRFFMSFAIMALLVGVIFKLIMPQIRKWVVIDAHC